MLMNKPIDCFGTFEDELKFDGGHPINDKFLARVYVAKTHYKVDII